MMCCDIVVAVVVESIVDFSIESFFDIDYYTVDYVVLHQDNYYHSYHAFDDYEYLSYFYLIMIRKTFQNFRNYLLNMMPPSYSIDWMCMKFLCVCKINQYLFKHLDSLVKTPMEFFAKFPQEMFLFFLANEFQFNLRASKVNLSYPTHLMNLRCLSSLNKD